MKIKQHLHITNPEAFLRGDYSDCFGLWDHAAGVEGWIVVGEIELDVNVDSGEVINVVASAIDEQIEKRIAEVQLLKARKNELLALTAL